MNGRAPTLAKVRCLNSANALDGPDLTWACEGDLEMVWQVAALDTDSTLRRWMKLHCSIGRTGAAGPATMAAVPSSLEASSPETGFLGCRRC